MNEQIAAILARIRDLENELEKEVAKGRAAFGPILGDNVAEFRKDVLDRHKRLKMGLIQFFKETPALNFLTSPVIYSLIAPLALLDLWVTIYQNICFRAYGIPRVVRSDYVIIDRHRLGYLNLIEAINCVFCGYANGVIAYAREIASRTEQHWCPIKHAQRVRDPHARYLKFLEYGDADGYREKLDEYRKENREEYRKNEDYPKNVE